MNKLMKYYYPRVEHERTVRKLPRGLRSVEDKLLLVVIVSHAFVSHAFERTHISLKRQ
mgnify:CR=1 FL=1